MLIGKGHVGVEWQLRLHLNKHHLQIVCWEGTLPSYTKAIEREPSSIHGRVRDHAQGIYFTWLSLPLLSTKWLLSIFPLVSFTSLRANIVHLVSSSYRRSGGGNLHFDSCEA